MKVSIMALTLFVLITLGIPTISSADTVEGQNLFKKKMRKYCGFSGVHFARQHTQDEWKEIYDNGKFIEESVKLCPRLNIDKIKTIWWEDIYHFTHEYSVGGSHIPEC